MRNRIVCQGIPAGGWKVPRLLSDQRGLPTLPHGHLCAFYTGQLTDVAHSIKLRHKPLEKTPPPLGVVFLLLFFFLLKQNLLQSDFLSKEYIVICTK